MPLDPLNEFGVCSLCMNQIKRYPAPPTKNEPHGLTASHSACVYDGVLKELIHLFKYKRKTALANVLSGLMIDFVKDNPDVIKDIDILTFVPMQNHRYMGRGFNQSKMLALNLSREFAIPLRDLLDKTVTTRNQNELSRGERLTNLIGAFKIKNGVRLEGLRALLVDDVMTTGATLSECASILLAKGARGVSAFTLARGI